MELEPIMSPKTLYAAIETLVTRSANHHDAGEAMKFAQAALNLAHIGSLGIVEPSTHTTENIKETMSSPVTFPPEQMLTAINWRNSWLMTAHEHQIEPTGDEWSIWLMCADRASGKTRAAAENLAWWAWETPGTRWLVSAPTPPDLRSVCFEGASGLLAVIPPTLVHKYNSSLLELTLTNGSVIQGIPASNPESFRGTQFHGGWIDELAAREYRQGAWDMIAPSMRLGQRPKLIASATPKQKPVVMAMINRDDVAVSIAPSFYKNIMKSEGTNLKRQSSE
jgi:phage terminase large subunit-like protein